MTFQYLVGDIRGTEPNYNYGPTRAARSLCSGPHPEHGRSLLPDTTGNYQFYRQWGIGEQSETAPVSISGTVTSFSGQPIANTILTLSGGNLPTPSGADGQFGTYHLAICRQERLHYSR